MTTAKTQLFRAFWLLLLAAMASVAMPRWFAKNSIPMLDSATPEASMEAILAGITGERDARSRLAAMFEKLPGSRPVLLLRAPQNSAAIMSAYLPTYLITYVAWPRAVVAQEVPILEDAETVAKFRERFSAVIFVYQPVPKSFPPGEHFGRGIVFVPLATPGT